MNEPPEHAQLPVATLPQGTVTTDPRALAYLAEAARPLLNDYLTAEKESSQERHEHEFRLAQLDQRGSELTQRRLYWLLWFVALFMAAIIGFAAVRDLWSVVTHLLSALLGLVSGPIGGYGIARRREADIGAHPSDE